MEHYRTLLLKIHSYIEENGSKDFEENRRRIIQASGWTLEKFSQARQVQSQNFSEYRKPIKPRKTRKLKRRCWYEVFRHDGKQYQRIKLLYNIRQVDKAWPNLQVGDIIQRVCIEKGYHNCKGQWEKR